MPTMSPKKANPYKNHSKPQTNLQPNPIPTSRTIPKPTPQTPSLPLTAIKYKAKMSKWTSDLPKLHTIQNFCVQKSK